MAMADAVNSSAEFLDPFDPLGFPEDFPPDVALPPDLLSDLVFDGDVEFSIEDLLNYDDCNGGECGDANGRCSGEADSNERSAVSGNGNSSWSGNYGGCDLDSGNSEVKVEGEKERKGTGVKRKKDRAEGGYGGNTKVRRSGTLEDTDSPSPCLSNVENEDDEKKKARLIRNRESAQLSRQRKKHYVEELEEKVRTMHSMITDLNGRISYFMAENASLRQQLGGNGGSGKSPPPAVYSAVPPPIPYPWIPCPNYVVRPAGAQVPLVPIPRLKPQQPVPAAKLKRTDGKKSESRTKKVASVSLLGLLAFMFLVRFYVPGVDFSEGGYGNLVSYQYSTSKGPILDQSRGRILSVSGNVSKFKPTNVDSSCGDSYTCRKNRNNKPHKGKLDRGFSGYAKKTMENSLPSPNSGRLSSSENACKPLFASLYVPRNDKLVKIDGNLIISSVLATEKATTRTLSESKMYQTTQSSAKTKERTHLAIAQSMASSLALPGLGRDAGRQSNMYTSATEYKKALPHGFMEKYKDNLKTNPGDRSLKEWFYEGLEGPIFSSGMCTELFQFDVAPSSADSGGIISAAAMMKSSDTKSDNSSSVKLKNRRFLYSQPVPVNGSVLNSTQEGFAKPPENSSFHRTKSKSMVVSVLLDPREAGNMDGDGMMQPKSISRIFVVVLVDSVKYITYSCGLPYKSNAPHLVAS